MPELNERLVELNRYGHPRVSHHGNGWFASVELFISSEGTNVDVKSEFGHPTPDSAVTQLEQRLRAMLRDLQSLPPAEAIMQIENQERGQCQN